MGNQAKSDDLGLIPGTHRVKRELTHSHKLTPDLKLSSDTVSWTHIHKRKGNKISDPHISFVLFMGLQTRWSSLRHDNPKGSVGAIIDLVLRPAEEDGAAPSPKGPTWKKVEGTTVLRASSFIQRQDQVEGN